LFLRLSPSTVAILAQVPILCIVPVYRLLLAFCLLTEVMTKDLCIVVTDRAMDENDLYDLPRSYKVVISGTNDIVYTHESVAYQNTEVQQCMLRIVATLCQQRIDGVNTAALDIAFDRCGLRFPHSRGPAIAAELISSEDARLILHNDIIRPRFTTPDNETIEFVSMNDYQEFSFLF
jgi:hypothetical protein